MEYITTKEASAQWGISPTRITILANEGRIPGAYRIGRSWLIPAGAAKPEKRKGGRTHTPKQEADNFSFPLYPFRSDWSRAKEEQLSEQQRMLLLAENAVFECRFEDAYPQLETILHAPEDMGTEIGALWGVGMCCIALNRPDEFSRIFLRLQMLLAQNPPHRDDLTFILDFLKTYVETIDTAVSRKTHSTELHEQSLPLRCMLIGYARMIQESMQPGSADDDLLEINLHFFKSTGATIVVGMLHNYLLGIHSLRGNLTAAEKHARAVVQLAFENKLYFPLATYYRYNSRILAPILTQYPKDFQEHCHRLAEQYEKNFTAFLFSLDQNTAFARLTDGDYPYVYGVLQDLSNTDMASRLGVSRPTVQRRLEKLYQKLGVSNKKELQNFLHSFM